MRSKSLSILNLSQCEKPKKGWDPIHREEDKYMTHVQIVAVKAIRLLYLVWPYLHDVMDQLEQGHLKLVQSADTWTSFLLKTVSHCNASCPIWNQLTLIQNLDQLLFLNWCTNMCIVHGALSWSNTSWWLVPCWSVGIMVFFTFFLWNNFSWCEVTVRKLMVEG